MFLFGWLVGFLFVCVCVCLVVVLGGFFCLFVGFGFGGFCLF